MSSTAEISESPGRILVVDDNADNRLLLASQLKMRGYQVIQADDGYEGLEMAALEQPDLILLDVMMPGIDGFTVCTRLKENATTGAIPVVMVTALREVEYRIRGIEAGADEFLSRPHHREELLIRVRALIQLKRARRRLEEERNRLQLLYDVSRAITAQLDLEQMMVQIITHTQSAVGAAKGTILLLDDGGNVTHKFTIRAGARAEATRHASQEIIRHGLAGWLVRHNRGEIITDVSKDRRWIAIPGDAEPCGSVIGVPLSRTNQGIGVLLLTHPETNYFIQEHLTLLTTIGAQVTAAIENAYLFAEVDEQRRKLEAILAQSTDVIITTDPYWRIAILNQAGERFFELSANNVIGQSLRHVPQLDVLLPLFVRANDRPVTQEVNLNNSKVLYASVSPIKGVGYVAVMQDITELKRIEGIRLTQERREKQTVKDTFSRYMGPRLVEHVLTTDPKLLGRRERRRAVVMFADLRNFTGMVVGVEPDQAILTLNEFFSAMTDVVHEFDGTIFDLAGDELMVGFNVPFDQPNAPYRALLTAVTMQRRFNTLRQKWQQQLNTNLGLGVGIDQGDVVVGNVGADTRMNFAMVGEAVNTAHRLVELAGDGQVIISEVIYRAVEKEMPRLLDIIAFESMGSIALKGKHQPQTLFRAQIERGSLPTTGPLAAFSR
jgi:PAS domain S-box-containing protein